MTTRAISTLLLFDTKMFLRSTISVFFMLFFPFLMIIMFGSIFGNNPEVDFGNRGTIDIMVPGLTIMITAVSGLLNLPLTLSEYREKKVLKRYQATPLGSGAIICSQFLINFVMTLLGTLILYITAALAYDLKMPQNMGATLAVFLLATSSIFMIGFFIASLAPSAKSANTIAMLIYFPCIFITGATVPLEVMGEAIMSIAQYIPLTHAVEALKSVWWGASLADNWVHLTVLGGTLIVFGFLSVKFFRWE